MQHQPLIGLRYQLLHVVFAEVALIRVKRRCNEVKEVRTVLKGEDKKM